MSTFASMGAVYASSPQQVTSTSASPDPSFVKHQLVAGMSTGPWSGCLSAQAGDDKFDNYALHTSPAGSALQYRETSAQSSPRSWDSPEQLGPTPWEAANQFHGLDPQLSGVAYLPTGRSNDVPTSYPVDAAAFDPTQGFSAPEDSSQHVRTQTEPYSSEYPASSTDGYASTPESSHPLSPSTTPLTVPSPPPRESRSRPPRESRTEARSQQNRRGTSTNSAADAAEQKEEPYAQLIYRAFMSTPERAMTLQELYKWFRENTDKNKDDTKGWQNSIRHNLSMNGAFTKRDRKTSNSQHGDAATGTSSGSQADSKKITEWYLEPWAHDGVQSTTRYRGKTNQRRSAAGHGGLSSRAYRGYPHHHSGSTSGSRKAAAAASAVLNGRMLRTSSRQGAVAAAALRCATAASVNLNAATTSIYPFPATVAAGIVPHHHQHHIHPYFSHHHHPHHAYHHQSHLDSTPSAMDYDHDFDYPPPAASTSSASSSSHSMLRAASDPGSATPTTATHHHHHHHHSSSHEPLTPEPMYADLDTHGSYHSGGGMQGMHISIGTSSVYDEQMEGGMDPRYQWSSAHTSDGHAVGVGATPPGGGMDVMGGGCVEGMGMGVVDMNMSMDVNVNVEEAGYPVGVGIPIVHAHAQGY